jgi:hypothetical protein
MGPPPLGKGDEQRHSIHSIVRVQVTSRNGNAGFSSPSSPWMSIRRQVAAELRLPRRLVAPKP